MEKYLQELIESQSRVIIPDFGAFINSRDDDEQHIVFNNFLTFNDGLLVSYICEKEGINSDQALEKVNEYITQIKNALSDNGEYHIEKIGTLHKSDEGFISFTEEKAEEPESDEVTTESETVVEEIEIAIPVKVDENDLLILDEEEEAKKEQVAAEPKAKIVTTVEKPTPPIHHTTHTTIIKEEKTTVIEEKRSNSWIWILLILLLLIFGAVALYFFTPVFDRFKGAKETETPIVEMEIPEVDEEVAISDSIEQVEEIVKEPVIIRQHHIIIGTFRDNDIAQQRVERLKSDGFDKAKVVENKGKFLVSMTWFTGISEALRYQEKLAGVDKIENWILSIDGEE